jgi:predicted RNA-binding Zn-ribbon protein involved in translation (DUF1610 family)
MYYNTGEMMECAGCFLSIEEKNTKLRFQMPQTGEERTRRKNKKKEQDERTR